MQLDLDFPHAYRIEINPELPGSGDPTESVVEFPAPMQVGRLGLTVRISPEAGQPWLGRFWITYGHGDVDLYSCINETTLCVVAGGSAYIIPVLDPSHWIPVEFEPVVEARRIPGSGLMVFAGSSRLGLFGAKGQVWATDWLIVDGIKIEKVNEKLVHGLGNDIFSETWLSFTVDVRTGDLKWC